MTAGRVRLLHALAIAAAIGCLAACGETYIDTAVTVPVDDPAASTTAPAIDANTPLPELLSELDGAMRHLDERIVDEQQPDMVLGQVERLWEAAEVELRATYPDSLFGFEQAIELARSGVERKRPADASKGYKLLVAAIERVVGEL